MGRVLRDDAIHHLSLTIGRYEKTSCQGLQSFMPWNDGDIFSNIQDITTGATITKAYGMLSTEVSFGKHLVYATFCRDGESGSFIGRTLCHQKKCPIHIRRTLS